MNESAPNWHELNRELETIQSMMINLGETDLKDTDAGNEIMDSQTDLWLEVQSAIDPENVCEDEVKDPRAIEIVAAEVRILRQKAQQLMRECPPARQRLLIADFDNEPASDKIYELRGWLHIEISKPTGSSGDLGIAHLSFPPGKRIIRKAGTNDVLIYWVVLQFEDGMRISIHKDHFPPDGIGVERVNAES